MTTTVSTPTQLWHEQSADLDTDPARGLTLDEATQRLTRHGPNQLAEKKPRPAWLTFIDQFMDVLVMVLLGAVVLVAAIGDIGYARGFIGSIIMNTRFAALLLTQFLSISSTGWINNKMAFL